MGRYHGRGFMLSITAFLVGGFMDTRGTFSPCAFEPLRCNEPSPSFDAPISAAFAVYSGVYGILDTTRHLFHRHVCSWQAILLVRFYKSVPVIERQADHTASCALFSAFV